MKEQGNPFEGFASRPIKPEGGEVETSVAEQHEDFSSREKQAISMGQRLGYLMKQPEFKEGLKATARTAANIGISVADMFPGVGDAVSWLADLSKFSKTTDIFTPDVSKTVAVGSEALEFASLGFLPTHAIESSMQAVKDAPRMKAAWDTFRKVMTAEKLDYDNSPELKEAISVFE